MKLRNNDGTPWVWWIGVPRLFLLAVAALIGFRYAFDLGWVGAAIAVGAGFGLAALVWGTFAWMSASGRQAPLPRRVLVSAARRRGVTTLECPNCHWRGPTSELIRINDASGGADFSCPSCGHEVGHSVAAF
jgi:predicted RNA-binding Zn-ribbon protein involved in translation (DUF1610 family)